MNSIEFSRDRSAHSLEALAPDENQYVAWSDDGKWILAHARDMNEFFQEVQRKGIENYVVSYIGPPDEPCLGAADL